MSEKHLTIERGNTVRIHGHDFEIFVNGNGNISLFLGDKFEEIKWIVEQRQAAKDSKVNPDSL